MADELDKPIHVPRDGRKAALILLAVLAAFYAFTMLGPVLRPFLIAIFVYYVSRSAVRYLARIGVPGWLGYSLLLVVVVGVATVVTAIVSNEAQAFRKNWPEHQKKIAAIVGTGTDTPRHTVVNFMQDAFNQYSRDALEFAFEASVTTLEILLMAVFYLIFLMLGADRLADRIRRAYPGDDGEKMLTVSHQINEGLENYMWVKTIISVGMGASAAAIMYFFGLKQWLLWGVAFFLLNYITYFGSIGACVPPILIAFLELSPLQASLLTALLIANRLVWIDYFEIKMSGKHMNIDSALLLLWVAYWGWQWGVVGLILAFPMATTLKIVLENLEPTRRMALLISDT